MSRVGAARRVGSIGAACGPVGGFTLIEVIGALMVLSVALLITAGLTAALTVQVRQATLKSELVSVAQMRLDSLAVLTYSQVPVGVAADTIEIEGVSYVYKRQVALHSSFLRQVTISLEPLTATGPDIELVTYMRPPW